jgi:thiamine monophosphate synthase
VPVEVKIIDLYDKLINDDMTSKGEYFMDGVHLSQKVMPIALEKLNDFL